jgi:hypothetical protein
MSIYKIDNVWLIYVVEYEGNRLLLCNFLLSCFLYTQIVILVGHVCKIMLEITQQAMMEV